MNRRESVDTVIQKIKDQLRSGGVADNLYRSVEGISQIAKAIYSHPYGTAWESKDRPLFTAGQQASLSRLFYNLKNDRHVGGDNNTARVAELMKMPVEEVEKMQNKPASASSGKFNPNEAYGVDEFYVGMMNKLNGVNSAVHQFASQYGVLKLEKDSDLATDIHLIPKALSSLISSGVAFLSPPLKVPTQAFLDKIKVPLRLLIVAVYLFLDVTRVAVSLQGLEGQRKTLTLLIALLEFLRGDWKKAILTFMGYYTVHGVWFGQMMKVYLTMFRTLSPTLQNRITYGALDVTKSFLIGIVLSVFQVAAPEQVRLPLIGVLEKIARKKATIDGVLTESGLPPREDYYSPSFEDLNNIQALMDDPEFVCSCEYEDLIQQADQSAMIHILFQFLRQPVTREYREKYTCGKGPCKPFVEALVATAKEKQGVEEEEEAEAAEVEEDDEEPAEPEESKEEPKEPAESAEPKEEPKEPKEEPKEPAKPTPQAAGRRRPRIRMADAMSPPQFVRPLAHE